MDESRLMVLALAREGFGGGDPERIEQMGTDYVLDMWELVKFRRDYETTVEEMNKPK